MPRSPSASRAGPTSTSTTADRLRAPAAMASRRSAGGSCWASSRSGPRRSASSCAFECEAPPLAELEWADLIVAADGASSAIRSALADDFGPSLDPRYCRYMWLGTDLVFDAFKFVIEETPARGLPGPRLSLRRPDEHVHRRDERGGVAARRPARAGAGSAAAGGQRHGQRRVLRRRCSPTRSRDISCSRTTPSGSTSSRSATADGAPTTSCCSATPRTQRTSRSARGRSWRWRTRWRWRGRFARSARTSRAATAAYEAERRPIVESTQRAAQASLEWFEGIGRYVEQERTQFAFNLLTRSRRVTYDNLRLRDPEFVQEVDDRFAARGAFSSRPADVRPAPPARAGAARTG